MNQHVLHDKIVIFVGISFLIVTLIYSSSATFVYAFPPDLKFASSAAGPGSTCASLDPEADLVIGGFLECCWYEDGGTLRVCQTCQVSPYEDYENCTEPQRYLEAPVLPEGALEVPPTDEGTAPPTADGSGGDDKGQGAEPSTSLTIVDSDDDSIPDEQDNCPSAANEDQQDSNNNGVGDACDQEQQLEEEQPPAVDTPQDQAEQEEPQDQGQQDEGNDNDGGDISNPEQEQPQ